MNHETLREQIRAQVRQALQRRTASPPAAAHGATENSARAAALRSPVLVPLHLRSAQHTAALTELFRRLAANPALLQLVQTGWLRFDLRVDPTALPGTAGAPAAGAAPALTTPRAPETPTCCASCRAGKACECQGDRCEAHGHPAVEEVPELQGVIGERALKTLAPTVKTVRLHPRAVLTPLAKDALRKRGIAIDRGATP